jgi:hypothetical protein
MADWEMFVGDLYPPLPLILTDSNGPINLANAASVGIIAASQSHTITGTASILQVSFTATCTPNSNQLTGVSSTLGLWVPGTEPWPSGSTLFSQGNLTAPVGSVGNWTLPSIQSISGSTITMSQPALSTATAGTITVIANMGYCQYVWLAGDTANAGAYSGVAPITWAAGSKVQTVPSQAANEFTLQINSVP